MFPGGFFAKTFFAGAYFAPADGGVSPPASDVAYFRPMIVSVGKLLTIQGGG